MPFDPATSAPDADAFAAPNSSSAELLAALFSASPTKALTPALLESSSDAALYHLLPLLLSTLQFVGECTVDRAAFIDLISALRDRMSTADPVLKLRFMLHAAHPSFNAYWRVSDMVDPAGDGDDPDDDDDEGERAITVEDFDEDDPDAQIPGIEDDGANEGDDEEREQQEGEQQDEAAGDEEVDRRIDETRRVVKQVTLSVTCSSELDVPSRDFWQSGVYAADEAGEVDVGHEYDLPSDTVINPFFRASDAPEGTPCAGSHVTVRKVFSSIARPKIVTIDDDDSVSVPPGVLVKKGDNLMQDLGVMHVLQALNAIWAGDDELTAEFTKPPIAVWYDVLPTGIDTGLMQAVAGLQSLKEFDWNQWADEAEGDDERVLDTVRTAAGSYIATYIIGYVVSFFWYFASFVFSKLFIPNHVSMPLLLHVLMRYGV